MLARKSNSYGIGIDIIEIDRIESSIRKNERFLTKVFTDLEIRYFQSVGMHCQSVAGYFAAKEAVGKALGTGIYKGEWKNIEIAKSDSGEPFVNLYGKIKEYAESIGITELQISISHCKNYAVANAIVIKGDI